MMDSQENILETGKQEEVMAAEPVQEAQEETASQNTQEEPAVQEETATPDSDWDIPKTTEMTEEEQSLRDDIPYTPEVSSLMSAALCLPERNA